MHLLLLLLSRDQGGLVLCEPSPHSACRLWSEVERQVFLVLVEKSELGALVGIDDCEYPRNRFPEVVAAILADVSPLPFISSICPVTPEISRQNRRHFRTEFQPGNWIDVHLCKLGRSTAGDLLDTKLAQLGFQLIQLLEQVVLALSPELAGLDFACRLCIRKSRLAKRTPM
jgi:hypothetical protein